MRNKAQLNREAILSLLQERCAVMLNKPLSDIDTDLRFRELGLESLHICKIFNDLSEQLGYSIPMTAAWEYPTINALSHHLTQRLTEKPNERVEYSSKTSAKERSAIGIHEQIAIVGMACRLPGGVNSPQQFWDLLCESRSGICEVPNTRWNIDEFLDLNRDAPGKMVTRWGGFLDSIDTFDTAFFGISAREAEQIDPQQRLALELAWEILESSNYVPSALKGENIGVFMGAMWSDYARLFDQDPLLIEQHSATGQDTSIISARISYLLGFQGTSLTVNTACSSSLVAVHLACQSLRLGEIKMALAGGVHIMSSPLSTVAMTKFGAMNPDGQCRAFDADANGYVRGEGGGIVLLKPLNKAILDGDRIYCVISGSATNNDGFSNGLTAPNPKAQEAVLQAAYMNAGIDPGLVHYIETHGPGTLLGDPIEAGSLASIFVNNHSQNKPLRLGSVKTNIGHLEAAAGIAGLIKTALMLHNRILVPNLNFKNPNPYIPFDEWYLQIQTKLESWPVTEDEILRAGVNSFGFGGTNCHMVLEEVPISSAKIFPFSAANNEELCQQVLQTLDFAKGLHKEQELVTLAHKLAQNDQRNRIRFAVVARSQRELISGLTKFSIENNNPETKISKLPQLIFVCSGQGSQHVGMARSLLFSEPTFYKFVKECDNWVREQYGWSIIEELLLNGDSSRLNQVDILQPVLFSVQSALGKLWLSWGIEPDVLVGHSQGEIVAAYLAGALSLSDALRVVCERSRLLLKYVSGQGAMLMVELSPSQLLQYVPELNEVYSKVVIGAYNSPFSSVISAKNEDIGIIENRLLEKGVKIRRVNIDYASHSPHMEKILPLLIESLSDIKPKVVRFNMMSTVTTEKLVGTELKGEYWAKNLGKPVQFAQVIDTLDCKGNSVFIELSFHPVLLGAIKQSLEHRSSSSSVLGSCWRQENEKKSLLESLASLYKLGFDLDWQAVLSGAPSQEILHLFQPKLLLLSAQSEEALRAQAAKYAEHIKKHPEQDLSDICYSAALYRTHFTHRLSAIYKTGEELVRLLHQVSETGTSPLVSKGLANTAPKIIFVYPGQGSQWLGMGRELFNSSEGFRLAIKKCDLAIQKEANFSVITELLANREKSRLSEIEVVQPVLFAMAVALTAMWQECGVTPNTVVGHSQGEVVAAYIAGVLNLEDAVKVICRRSRILKRIAGNGAMAMVELGVEQIREKILVPAYLGRLSIAVSNSASSTVVSGEIAAVEQLLEELSAKKIFCSKVQVDIASHSPQIDVLETELMTELADLKPQTSKVKFISTVTTKLLEGKELTGEYWYRNLREPVYFGKVMEQVWKEKACVVIEISAHPLLTMPIEEVRQKVAGRGVVVSTLKKEKPQQETFYSSLGAAHCYGAKIEWRKVISGRLIELPTYEFQRQRYWLESKRKQTTDVTLAGLQSPLHPLLGAMTSVAGEDSYLFSGRLSLQAQPWLSQHQVYETMIMPGTVFLELAWAAGQNVGATTVAELTLVSPLVLNEKTSRQLQLKVEAADEKSHYRFAIYSKLEKNGINREWIKHATGVLLNQASTASEKEDLLDWPPSGAEQIEIDGYYERLSELGLSYGPVFQGLSQVYRRGDILFAKVDLLQEAEEAEQYGIHPVLMDMALHTIFFSTKITNQSIRLPFEWKGARLYATGAKELYVQIKVVKDEVEIKLYDGALHLLAYIEKLILRETQANQIKVSTLEHNEHLYTIGWQAVELTIDNSNDTQELYVVLGRGELAKQLKAPAFEDVVGLKEYLSKQTEIPKGIIIDTATVTDSRGDEENIVAKVINNTQRVLQDVQNLITTKQLHNSELIWITKKAVSTGVDDGVIALSQSSLWGMIRSVRNEHLNRTIRLIDIDDLVSEKELSKALYITETSEMAIRSGAIFIPSLVPEQVKSKLILSDSAYTYRLIVEPKGSLEGLKLALSKEASRPLAVNEVRVQIKACGLNFRDVLGVFGMYSSDVGTLGFEGAGIVIEVGKDVSEFSSGDRVMGLFSAAAATHSITDQNLIIKIPAQFTFVEAATIPVNFLTAYYALFDLGKLQVGERVLIHAATGGTGMAATQLARYCGAEVFATASPSKWETLFEQGFDPSHIASSRNLEFVQQFLVKTADQGMDVVLNSLAREYVDASLRLLPNGGRFLEMGKTDKRDEVQIASKYRGVIYQALDLMEASKERIKRILKELVRLFEARKLKALPYAAYDLREAKSAFRYMAQARHIGKLVLIPPQKLRLSGTVLITGGTGELGRLIAKHLIKEYGAKHLMLTSRKGMATPGAAELKAKLVEQGATVNIVACDVSDYSSLKAVIESISELVPLIGVVHCAGALDDGVVLAQNEDKLKVAMLPKVAGGWNLHLLSKEKELEFFIMYSSVLGVIGSPGQCNYAAGNTFLDALAAYRQKQGLPAQSLAWGLWQQAGLGMTAYLSQIDLSRMQRQGIYPLTQEQGLKLFDMAFNKPDSLLIPAHLNFKDKAVTNTIPAILREIVKDSSLCRANVGERKSVSATRQKLAAATDSERLTIIQSMVRSEIAIVLAIANVELLPADKPLKEIGLDSLMAVELRNRLSAKFNLELPATLAFDFPTIDDITNIILQIGFSDLSSIKVSLPLVKNRVSVDEPIAIVSMACRLPGGISTPDQYWKLLEEGKELIELFPTDRWDVDSFYDPDPDAIGKTYCKEGGFLKNIDKFDAAFFGIAPREAQAMDPQQRLILETVWEALERGGIRPFELDNSLTGVYIGSTGSDYGLWGEAERFDGYRLTGVTSSVLSGRVAYLLGLQGAAITIDTACSSSLVALHLATQALRLGECELALAGGVQVMNTPARFIEFSRLRGVAPDGRCKSFSAKANGAGWSEGCGILVLKRLSDAQKDGDKILALIRGTAVNQDGRSQGLTAPNGPAQQRVILRALELSNLSPSDIDAIEAHGTGTNLGDPIEAGALEELFGKSRPAGRPLYLGSSKSNIGHTQAAAGVFGVMKMVLALQHEKLPKSLYANEPSPHINWEQSGLELLHETREWLRGERIRRTGVSSFGISGTNAHVILEEGHEISNNKESENESAHIGNLLLAAQSEAALRTQAANYAAHINTHPKQRLADICHTAALYRTHFSHRLSIAFKNRTDLVESLQQYAAGINASPLQYGLTSTVIPQVAFLFTGQGSQYTGMAAELYESEPIFHKVLEECASIVDPLIGRSLLKLIFTEAGTEEGDLLNQTQYTQPALFALEYSLYEMWKEWGIKPVGLLGHSIGELVAATAAGVFSLADGIKLAVARGRLMGALQAGGAMLSVEIGEAEAETLIKAYEGKLSIAALNSPKQTVISGNEVVIVEFAKQLEISGISHKRLAVSHAFHSHLMDEVLVEFEKMVAGLTRQVANIPIASNITGKLEKEIFTKSSYWSRQIREVVRFSDGIKALIGQGITTFIDLGPQPILSGLVAQCSEGSKQAGELSCYGSLKREQPDSGNISRVIGSLWLKGIKLEWSKILPGKFVEIPTYPFQRKRYWLNDFPSRILKRTSDLENQKLNEDETTLDNGNSFYHIKWKERDRSALSQKSDLYQGCYLILADPYGVGESLAKQLEQKGLNCIIVFYGEQFHRQSENIWIIPPNSESAIESFLKESLENYSFLAAIIHLWSLDKVVDIDINSLKKTQSYSSESLLLFTQALLKTKRSTYPKIWLITRGVLTGEDASSLAASPTWGLGKVIALEHPELWGGIIDLDIRPHNSEVSFLIEELFGSEENHIAFRDGKRFVPRLTPVALPEMPIINLEFNQNDYYLITGGLGVLGVSMAKWLISLGAKNIVLIGRRTMPLSSQSGDLSNIGIDSTDEPFKMELFRSLEQKNTKVQYLTVDVSDREQMSSMFKMLNSQNLRLKGVIHAAGLLSITPLKEMTLEEWRSVVNPKLYGSWVLHELTSSEKLNFFILFSSITSIWGSKKLSHYAAANQFLDSLAQYRFANGQVSLSINWGPWVIGGMAKQELQQRFKKMGIFPLSEKETINVILRLLNSRMNQIAVAQIDWKRFIPIYNSQSINLFFDEVSKDVKVSKDTIQNNESSLRKLLHSYNKMDISFVKTVVAEVLGLPSPEVIDENCSLRDIGLDSLMALELTQRIEAYIPEVLLIKDLLSEASISQLVKKWSETNALEAKKSSTDITTHNSNTQIEINEVVTVHKILKRDFQDDVELHYQLIEAASSSYEDPRSILYREINRADTLYVAKSGGVVSGFFLVGSEEIQSNSGNSIPTLYAGFSATREDAKDTGLIYKLYRKGFEDAIEWEKRIGRSLIIWGTTATPIVFLSLHKMLPFTEPYLNGSFTEQGAEMASLIKQHINYQEIKSNSHPFVLHGVAHNTLYSEHEANRIEKINNVRGFLLFKELGIDERKSDRLLFISKTTGYT